MGKTFSTGLLTNGIWQDASNNIGIGGSPSGSYKLEVTGGLKTTGQYKNTFAGQSISIDTGTTASARMQLQNSGANAGITVESSTGGDQFSNTSAYSMAIGTYTEKNFHIGTNSVTRMTILSSGNIGIGLTTPNAPLDIATSSGSVGTFKLQQWSYSSGQSAYNLQLNNITSGGLVRYSFDLTNNSTPYLYNLVLDRGNVGISEATPNAKLDIVGPSNAPNTYGTLLFRNNSSTGIAFGASGTSYTWMQGNVFGSGTQMIAINPQGSNVSIGTTTDFGYKLNLNGQPGANGYTAWTNWSDSRLKENVTDLETTNVLDKICAIRPVTYNYNELSGFDDATRSRRISGFIAQELMEVFPDMVGTITKDEVEYYDTNLSNLDLYLVKAIQELSAQNQDLKSRLDKAGL